MKTSLLAVAIAATLLMAGCARPVGDFGRADRDALHDEFMPEAGRALGHSVKEPVSDFNLADEEKEMRDRVWRYLVSPHAYDWFGDTAAELQRTGIQQRRKPLKIELYYRWIHTERFASSPVRFDRMTADIADDIDGLPDTFRSICVVQNMDRQRGIASNGLDNLEELMLKNAAARQAENEAVTDWFVRALDNRYESYSYALDHLLLETPHAEAVATNARLNEMAAWVEAADRGDFCRPPAGRRGGAHADAIPSRRLMNDRVLGS